MTEDPKRWKDDENAPEALRTFLLDVQAEAPVLPEALHAKVVQSVAKKPVRVMPFVVGGVLALAAAALLAVAMSSSTVPAVPVPTLEPEPLDAGPDSGPDAPTLETIEVERVCGEEDVNYACAVHVALPHTYDEVETRQAFGVAPPTCRSGHPFQPDEITQVDATHFTITGPPSFTPQESIRVCAYQHGLLVATGSVEGQRQSPSVRIAPRHDRYDVFVSAERLDHDVEAVSLIRIPMEDFNGDGFVNEDDHAVAIARIGCKGTEVAGWSAESFNRIAALRRESGDVALMHHAARGDELHTPFFLACVETARGSDHQARVFMSEWPEEQPMVLTPSGEVRIRSVRPMHELLTLAEPDATRSARVWMRTNAVPQRHGESMEHTSKWIVSERGRRAFIPRYAALEGDNVMWSDGVEERIRSRSPGSPADELATDVPDWSAFHPVFINGARVSLPWRGREIERVEWIAPSEPEPIRALPEEASGCLIATVLEVDAIPEGVTRIGIAARRSTLTPGTRIAMDCTEQNLGIELPAEDLVPLQPDADGVRRIAFEFSVTPPDFDDMGPDRANYCDAGYQIIACVRDETGLHALPGALGRWTQSGPACFTADTPIATPSGNASIASLQPGMAVLAFDAQTQTRVVTHVTRLIPRGERPILALTLSNGQTMHVTAEHPLLDANTNAFRTAGSFVAGDALRGLEGEVIHIVQMIDTGERAPVFDLSVEGPHTYFANGVVAHNY